MYMYMYVVGVMTSHSPTLTPCLAVNLKTSLVHPAQTHAYQHVLYHTHRQLVTNVYFFSFSNYTRANFIPL